MIPSFFASGIPEYPAIVIKSPSCDFYLCKASIRDSPYNRPFEPLSDDSDRFFRTLVRPSCRFDVCDEFNAGLIGWNVHTNHNLEPTPLAMTLRRRQAGFIHHSDQGSEYMAYAYTGLVEDHGGIVSASADMVAPSSSYRAGKGPASRRSAGSYGEPRLKTSRTSGDFLSELQLFVSFER